MITTDTQTAAISEFAIIVNSEDNVAVVKTETFPGLLVSLPDGRIVEVKDAVTPGHRFALRKIPPENSSANTISRLARASESRKANGLRTTI